MTEEKITETEFENAPVGGEIGEIFFDGDEEFLYEEYEEDEEGAPKGKGELIETAFSGTKSGILVSVYSKSDEASAAASFAELERLFDTAGGVTLAKVVQQREKPDGRTCVGRGKLDEIRELTSSTGAELLIFDTELSPMQIKEIERECGDEVSVIDRSMLILDIFASHATSAEGRLQVELAQLGYTAPRLMGKGKAMSRLGGGIGTRGPGESKLEIDRRRLRARIGSLEKELEKLEAIRATQRASRDRSRVSKCAIVGYTNAGKSTLLNALTGAGILAEDKLFATLDPTTRKFTLPSGSTVLLTDTVGFIRQLPHHLIKAFRSTLDEAVFADALLIVCDASDPDLASQIEVTRSTLEELGALGKPTVFVFNKCDAIDPNAELSLRALAGGADEKSVFVSALTGEGLSSLAEVLEEILSCGKKRVRVRIPLSDGAALSLMYKICEAVEVEYGSEFIEGEVTADAASAGRIKEYIIGYDELFGSPDDE